MKKKLIEIIIGYSLESLPKIQVKNVQIMRLILAKLLLFFYKYIEDSAD